MTIAFVGDLHSDTRKLQKLDDMLAQNDEVSAVIQVGDMGWYKRRIPLFERVNLKKKWYWIDGNHEQHDLLKDYRTVTELLPNFFFVPRGRVMELEGKRIAFMGGAGSVDKAFNADWSLGENITVADEAELDGVADVDVFVTHTPPNCIIKKHFNPLDLLMFGLSPDWTDPNAVIIENIWKRFGQPLNVSGHMHASILDGNARILNIDEVVYL